MYYSMYSEYKLFSCSLCFLLYLRLSFYMGHVGMVPWNFDHMVYNIILTYQWSIVSAKKEGNTLQCIVKLNDNIKIFNIQI